MSDYTTDGKGQNTMGKKLQPKLRFRGFTDAWEQRKLGDILSYEQPYEYIVSSDDYSPVARTPVLTAGKTLILGYTNEADGIKAVTKDSPVIIFDDFTASSHIIDYSFKIKSSAMKILSLRDSENDLYCIYYALTRIIRPSASHERQWISKYARATVTIPSKDEQQVIGDFLRKLDRLIAAEKRKLDLLQKKKTTLLRQIFGQKLRFKGYNNPWERRKGSDIIHVRKETNSKPLTDTVDIELENLIEGGGLQGDISLRTASTSVFREHDTLFGRLRPYLRKFWLADISGVKSGEIWALFSPTLKSEFLYALTQSAQFLNPALQTAGTKMPRAEWKAIAEACFTIPETDEQEKIGQLFRQLEHLTAVETRKIDLLSVKKKALLQKMFV